MEQILIWTLVAGIILAVFIPYFLHFRKSHKLVVERRHEARAMGITRPRAQFPLIDRSLCIGCGSCVRACPESDVLGVVWGTSEIINGERCVGHGFCESACPVGAIKIGLGDIKDRPDLPVLSDQNETTVPGLFIAGELGGLSLIRHAISQGQKVVTEIARRIKSEPSSDMISLVIVGAGPAGLSASLAALQHNLSYLVIDEGEIGGTILHYPRKKLVMTQPVEIPLFGWLRELEYSKESLMETWRKIVERFHVNIQTNEKLVDVHRTDRGFDVMTQNGQIHSEFVVLAMGRRGTPRKLGVPGEDLAKVMYKLTDAQSYSGKHMLIVGGGDSAVEAAIGLARQKNNVVSISYRKSKFVKIKKKNEDTIGEFIRSGKILPLFDSEVLAIHESSVLLSVKGKEKEIPNDYVIIQAGGIPPFEMMKKMGILFGGQSVSIPEADARLRPVEAGQCEILRDRETPSFERFNLSHQ